jgi:hypothetical protein
MERMINPNTHKNDFIIDCDMGFLQFFEDNATSYNGFSSSIDKINSWRAAAAVAGAQVAGEQEAGAQVAREQDAGALQEAGAQDAAEIGEAFVVEFEEAAHLVAQLDGEEDDVEDRAVNAEGNDDSSDDDNNEDSDNDDSSISSDSECDD